eukprot:1736185-Rhodomonas_salina.1
MSEEKGGAWGRKGPERDERERPGGVFSHLSRSRSPLPPLTAEMPEDVALRLRREEEGREEEITIGSESPREGGGEWEGEHEEEEEENVRQAAGVFGAADSEEEAKEEEGAEEEEEEVNSWEAELRAAMDSTGVHLERIPALSPHVGAQGHATAAAPGYEAHFPGAGRREGSSSIEG